MFAVCKGLHCAGCKPQFSIPVPVLVIILCLIFRSQIAIIVRDIIIGASVLFLGMALVMAITYPILMRILMPRVMYMSPAAVEAHNEREIANAQRATGRKAVIRAGQRPVVDVSYSVEILPRTPHEWPENGQRNIPNRRYPPIAGRHP
jgi:hypothetical protein